MRTKRLNFCVAAATLAAALLVFTGCPQEPEEVDVCEHGALAIEVDSIKEVPPELPTGYEMGTFKRTQGALVFDIVPREVSYEYWYPVRSWAEKTGVGFTFSNPKEGGDGRGGTGVVGKAADSNADATDLKYGYSGDPNLEIDSGHPFFQATGKTLSGIANKPVCDVSLRDAIVWANALSLATGKSPVYRCEHGNVLADATKPVETYVDNGQMTGKNGYRLPTKDEWTHAIMAGKTTIADAFPGKSSPYGYYTKNRVTTLDKSNSTNAWGISDMLSNAWEWTFTEGVDANTGKYPIMGGDYNLKIEDEPTNKDNLPVSWEDPTQKGSGAKAIGLRVMLNY